MVLKSCLVISCLLVAVIAEEKYTDKYDNINVQEIIENKRLLYGYTNCLLERGKCTPAGKELKEHVVDALETGCIKCTKFQKNKSIDMITHLIKHERGIWKELTDKYDPEGVWRAKYEEEAKKNGIVIPKD